MGGEGTVADRDGRLWVGLKDPGSLEEPRIGFVRDSMERDGLEDVSELRGAGRGWEGPGTRVDGEGAPELRRARQRSHISKTHWRRSCSAGALRLSWTEHHFCIVLSSIRGL